MGTFSPLSLTSRAVLANIIFLAVCAGLGRASDPAYWSFAPTPPMGWNSYDAFGGSVTEDEVMSNAMHSSENVPKKIWRI